MNHHVRYDIKTIKQRNAKNRPIATLLRKIAHSSQIHARNIYYRLREVPVLCLFAYQIRDIYISRRDNQIPEFKDFWLFAGMRGRGKTLSLSRYISNLRKRWKDKILIVTNFEHKEQDLAFTDWKMFQEDFDRPVVFAIDEIQNEFMSRAWKSFPLPVLQEFTQSRKKGKMLVATAQKFNMVDKALREYIDIVIVPQKVLFSRLYRLWFYEGQNYLSAYASLQNGMDFKPETLWTEWYIAHDWIRQLYDKAKLVLSTREKEYRPATEFTPAQDRNPTPNPLTAPKKGIF